MDEDKKRMAGLCSFTLVTLFSTAAFICGLYATGFCSFVARDIEFSDNYNSPAQACEALGLNPTTCGVFMGKHGVGFYSWQGTVPVDETVCLSYTQVSFYHAHEIFDPLINYSHRLICAVFCTVRSQCGIRDSGVRHEIQFGQSVGYYSECAGGIRVVHADVHDMLPNQSATPQGTFFLLFSRHSFSRSNVFDHEEQCLQQRIFRCVLPDSEQHLRDQHHLCKI